MIFANLLHLSYNMWCDWQNPAVKSPYYAAKPYLRFDDALWNDLLDHGLVDELHLMIGAVILGAGTPAFERKPNVHLRLVDVHKLDDSENMITLYDVATNDEASPSAQVPAGVTPNSLLR